MNASSEYKVNRQAVVVIHGIGEQKPNSTLRSFVLSLLTFEQGKLPENKKGYWVKPNTVTEHNEIKRIVAQKYGDRPETDFYEYYWAHLIKGTGWRKILYWIRPLYWRKWSEVPKRLKNVLLISNILFTLLGLIGAIFLLTALAYVLSLLLPNLGFIAAWDVTGSILRYGSAVLVSFLILGLIFNVFKLNQFARTAIGDAATYLMNSAENFEVREKIRQEGVKFLLELHKSEKYDRIVVVGHSLGSVIAYDIIGHAWVKTYKELCFEEEPRKRFIALVNSLVVCSGEIMAYREKQMELWDLLRTQSKSWVISDFLTLGSPLSHGKYLLADSDYEFDKRVADREFATCPPRLDSIEPGNMDLDGKTSYYFNLMGASRLHFAAPFAPVRWTNAYYNDDLVGGPINGIFGNGILDKELECHWVWMKSHTHYWLGDEWLNVEIDENTKEYESLKFIYETLGI